MGKTRAAITAETCDRANDCQVLITELQALVHQLANLRDVDWPEPHRAPVTILDALTSAKFDIDDTITALRQAQIFATDAERSIRLDHIWGEFFRAD